MGVDREKLFEVTLADLGLRPDSEDSDSTFVGELEGVEYQIVFSESRSGATLEINVSTVAQGDVSVNRESLFYRAFKAARITLDIRTGDGEFDAHCHVGGTDPAYARAALQPPAVRAGVRAILDETDRSVELSSGAVRSSLPVKKGTVSPASVRRVVAHMAQIRDAWQQASLPIPQGKYLTRRLLAAIALGVAYFVLPFAMLPWTMDYRALDESAIQYASWKVALPILLMMVVLQTLLVRGRSDSHGWVLGLLVAAGFGVLTSAESAFDYVNGAHDSGEGLTFQTVVVDRRMLPGGYRRSASYYVTVDGPRKDATPRELPVRESFYEAAPEGTAVEVTLYPGSLGYEWFRWDELSILTTGITASGD